MLVSIYLSKMRSKPQQDHVPYLQTKLRKIRNMFDVYLNYDDLNYEGEGIYTTTLRRIEDFIREMESGATIEMREDRRNMLVVNLNQWNISLKNPDDELERF